MPASTAIPNDTYVATSTWRGGTSPPAVTRTGPRRSSASAPRRASEESLDRLVPTWMNRAPSSAARKRSEWTTCSTPANAVPTSPGATAAGSVRGREAINQIRIPLIFAAGAAITLTSRPPRELGEVRAALLQVGVAPFLGLLAHVEQEVGVVGELLDPGHPVLVGVE